MMNGIPVAAPTAGTLYNCGGCGAKNSLKPQDPVRCRTCGYRILYKERTKKRKLILVNIMHFL